MTPTAQVGDKMTCPARDPWPLSPPLSKLVNKELWQQGRSDTSAQGRGGAPRLTWLPVRDLSAGQSFSSLWQHVLPPAPGLGSRNGTGSPRVQDRCPSRGYHSCAPSSVPAPRAGWPGTHTRAGVHAQGTSAPAAGCSRATLAHPKPEGQFLWPSQQTAHPQDAHLQRAPGHLCSLSAPVPQAAPACPGTVNQLWPRQSSCNRIGSNTV